MSLVKKSVHIKGSQARLPWKVEHIFIGQSFGEHHTFEIQAFLPKGEICTLDDLKAILGEYIEIQISSVEKPDEKTNFLGFVDGLVPGWYGGRQRLKITGYSPTMLMDGGPVFRTFSGQDIRAIFNKVIASYSGSCFPEINMGTGGMVFYSVQNQESDYRYLCRLADAYEQLFWYDGTKLNVGKLAGQSLTLEYGIDLQHLEASLNLCPLQFSLQGYSSEENEIFRMRQSSKSAGVTALSQCAMEKSVRYPLVKTSLCHTIRTEKDLQRTERQLISRQTNELVKLQGISTNPAITIGTCLMFDGIPDALPGLSSEDSFRVVRVDHRVASGNSYQNTFVAIPNGQPFPLNMPNVTMPVCGPLVAEVVENCDREKNQGRVKVKFPVDLEQNISPWMKVLTPFTGHNGFYFLPEIGEKVLVFFEDFHPEKAPFVLGSFFHKGADASQWADANNRKKGWQTEKASILFDDNTGQLTIRASSISIEASEKLNVSTKADGKIKLESPDIQLSARDKMELAGGAHLKQKAARIDIN